MLGLSFSRIDYDCYLQANGWFLFLPFLSFPAPSIDSWSFFYYFFTQQIVALTALHCDIKFLSLEGLCSLWGSRVFPENCKYIII